MTDTCPKCGNPGSRKEEDNPFDIDTMGSIQFCILEATDDTVEMFLHTYNQYKD